MKIVNVSVEIKKRFQKNVSNKLTRIIRYDILKIKMKQNTETIIRWRGKC